MMKALILLCLLVVWVCSETDNVRPESTLVITVLDLSSEAIIRDTFTLIRSYRLFGGTLNDATFRVYIPIESIYIDNKHHLKALTELNVEIEVMSQIQSPLPRTLNKLTALKLIKLNHYSHVLWLDGDVVIFNDPFPIFNQYPLELGGIQCVPEFYSYLRRYPSINETNLLWNPNLPPFILQGENEVAPHGLCNTGVILFHTESFFYFLTKLYEIQETVINSIRFASDRFLDSLLIVAAINQAGLRVVALPYTMNYMAFFEVEIFAYTHTTQHEIIFAHLLSFTELYCYNDDYKDINSCQCTYLNHFYPPESNIIKKVNSHLLPQENCNMMSGAIKIPVSRYKQTNSDDGSCSTSNSYNNDVNSKINNERMELSNVSLINETITSHSDSNAPCDINDDTGTATTSKTDTTLSSSDSTVGNNIIISCDLLWPPKQDYLLFFNSLTHLTVFTGKILCTYSRYVATVDDVPATLRREIISDQNGRPSKHDGSNVNNDGDDHNVDTIRNDNNNHCCKNHDNKNRCDISSETADNLSVTLQATLLIHTASSRNSGNINGTSVELSLEPIKGHVVNVNNRHSSNKSIDCESNGDISTSSAASSSSFMIEFQFNQLLSHTQQHSYHQLFNHYIASQFKLKLDFELIIDIDTITAEVGNSAETATITTTANSTTTVSGETSEVVSETNTNSISDWTANNFPNIITTHHQHQYTLKHTITGLIKVDYPLHSHHHSPSLISGFGSVVHTGMSRGSGASGGFGNNVMVGLNAIVISTQIHLYKFIRQHYYRHQPEKYKTILDSVSKDSIDTPTSTAKALKSTTMLKESRVVGALVCCDTMKGIETIKNFIRSWSPSSSSSSSSSNSNVSKNNGSTNSDGGDSNNANDNSNSYNETPETQSTLFLWIFIEAVPTSFSSPSWLSSSSTSSSHNNKTLSQMELLKYEFEHFCNGSNFPRSSNSDDDGISNSGSSHHKDIVKRIIIMTSPQPSSLSSSLPLLSHSLANSLPANTLSFIYLDVYHSYSSYLTSLHSWYTALGIGGILMGSRYNNIDLSDSENSGDSGNGGDILVTAIRAEVVEYTAATTGTTENECCQYDEKNRSLTNRSERNNDLVIDNNDDSNIGDGGNDITIIPFKYSTTNTNKTNTQPEQMNSNNIKLIAISRAVQMFAFTKRQQYLLTYNEMNHYCDVVKYQQILHQLQYRKSSNFVCDEDDNNHTSSANSCSSKRTCSNDYDHNKREDTNINSNRNGNHRTKNKYIMNNKDVELYSSCLPAWYFIKQY